MVFPKPLHFGKSDNSTQYILRLAGLVLLEASLSDSADEEKVQSNVSDDGARHAVPGRTKTLAPVEALGCASYTMG